MAVTFPAPLNLYLPLSGGTLTGGLTVALGTITADQQNFSGTATWNNAAVTFTALKLNVTSTASAAASLLMDLQVASTSKFNVSKSGDVNLALGAGINWSSSNDEIFSETTGLIRVWLGGARRIDFDQNNKRIGVPSDWSYGIGSATTSSAPDTNLSRLSGGLWAVGTGAAGSIAGSMSMTNLTLAGTLTVPGVTTAALSSTGTFTSGAGAQVGTLTNAPTAGNPTSWIKIVDNGVTRYIPAW